jgi:hypothetical protein
MNIEVGKSCFWPLFLLDLNLAKLFSSPLMLQIDKLVRLSVAIMLRLVGEHYN